MSTFNISNPVKVANPVSNVDSFYGPYDSVAEAFAAIALVAAQGRTVGVRTPGGIVEYWFKELPAGATYVESELVEKTSGASGTPPETMWINTNNVPQSVGGFTSGQPATPALGLSFEDFANKLLFPGLAPEITAFSASVIAGPITPPSSTQLEYLQPSGTIRVTWAYNIRTAGANVKNIKLRWKRTSTGGWSAYVVDTAPNVGLTTYDFAFTGNALAEGYVFELTVTDSGDNTVTTQSSGVAAPYLNVTVPMKTYVAPSTTTSIGNIKEKNLIAETVSRTVVVQNPYRPVTAYQWEVAVNGGAFSIVSDLPAQTGLNNTSNFSASYTISAATKAGITSADRIQLRLVVTDAQQTTTIANVYESYHVYPVFASTVTPGVETKQASPASGSHALVLDSITAVPSFGTALSNSYLLVAGDQVVALPPTRVPVASIWVPNATESALVLSDNPVALFDSVTPENRTINGEVVSYTVYRKTANPGARNIQFRK